MLKGFCTFLTVAILMAASSALSAQVYRCETASGVVYADFPCGEEAEEIVIDVVEPATPVPAETELADESDGLAAVMTDGSVNSDDAAAVSSTEAAASEVHTLSDFSKMLVSQRETQISEIDQQLSDLKAQVASDEFKESDPTSQAELLLKINDLEVSRESIINQYETLIAEAESRAQ